MYILILKNYSTGMVDISTRCVKNCRDSQTQPSLPVAAVKQCHINLTVAERSTWRNTPRVRTSVLIRSCVAQARLRPASFSVARQSRFVKEATHTATRQRPGLSLCHSRTGCFDTAITNEFRIIACPPSGSRRDACTKRQVHKRAPSTRAEVRRS